MGLEHHVRFIPEQFFRFQYIFGPGTGIPHLSAPEGVQVVHGAGTVFCQPQSPVIREIGIHLCRSFRAGGQLELYFYPVNAQGFILRNFIGRRQQPNITHSLTQTDADGQFAFRSRMQMDPVLILGPPSHRTTCVNILADRMLQETFRRNHNHFAAGQLVFQGKVCISRVFLFDQTVDTAVVVNVGMAVEDRNDVQRTKMLFHQRFGFFHILLAHEHIKHDPAVFGTDERDVSHIVTPDLVNTLAHFKEPGITVEQGIPPQAGIGSIRRLGKFFHKIVTRRVPDHMPVFAANHQSGRRFQQPPQRIFLFRLVVKVKLLVPGCVGLSGKSSCVLCKVFIFCLVCHLNPPFPKSCRQNRKLCTVI